MYNFIEIKYGRKNGRHMQGKPPEPPRLKQFRENYVRLNESWKAGLFILITLSLLLASIIIIIISNVKGNLLFILGLAIFASMFFICILFGYFVNKNNSLYLYDHGHAALAIVSEIFLRKGIDSEGRDYFNWKIKWIYEVDGKWLETKDDLSNAPEHLNVGSHVWILYDKRNPSRSKIYEGFNSKGEYILGKFYDSFDYKYDSVEDNPRPGIYKPPITTFDT